eukprot:scaffold11503_cov76-Cylindrotheca_fusiformis.AAC.2
MMEATAIDATENPSGVNPSNRLEERSNQQEDSGERCSFRSCPKITGAVQHECYAPDCNKKIHYACFQSFLLAKHKMRPLPTNKVACTKKCYFKAHKELSGGGDDKEGGRKGRWTCDGLKGPEDSHTSMRILLDWWMEEGNYTKFCGKKNEGVRKSEFARLLAQKMTKETTSQRDAKNVLNKIQHIEKKFREAHNFATSETGAGLQAEDQGTFEDAVNKKCPYYYDLVDVMADRASSAPKATSYDIGGDDDSDDDDDVSDVSGGVSVGGVSKRSTSASLGVAKTSSSKKRRKGASSTRSSYSLIDDSAVAAIADSNAAADSRTNELARHNKVMESIETSKVKWKGKNEELEYKMNLLDNFESMKDKGWSDKKIVKFFPDMKQVIEADTSSEEDN